MVGEGDGVVGEGREGLPGFGVGLMGLRAVGVDGILLLWELWQSRFCLERLCSRAWLLGVTVCDKIV